MRRLERRGTMIALFAAYFLVACSSDPGGTDHEASNRGDDAADARAGDVPDDGATDSGRCEPSQDIPEPDQVRDGRPVFVAAETLEEVVIDGALDEAIYADAPAMTFADESGDSDNEVRVHTLFDDEHLYLAFRVTDDDIDIDEEEPLNTNDGVEVVLDADNDAGDEPEDDHHWLIRADGDIHTKRYVGPDDEPNTDLDLDLEAQQVSDGYILELAVALDDLGIEPDDADRAGILLVNNDRDEGDWHYFTWPEVDDFKNPSAFGEVYFAASSCRGEDGPDAGPDTGPGTDSGPTDDAGHDSGSEDPCDDGGDYEGPPVDAPVPLGGGPDYGDRVCEEDADQVVASLSELEAALDGAGSGDVVFVDPDAEIDMGFDANLDVPAGVTLAGGRGCACRSGALLYTDDIVKEDYDHETVLSAHDNARITGLRIRGPLEPEQWIPLDEQDHYLDGKGIDAAGADVEIDNNELWGFANAGVSGAARTHVHHNHIHNMVRDGLGYGVNGGDEVLIEYNYFDWVRHAVASGGRRSYEARYNHNGPHAISHIFDMHRDGGSTIEIHHNTVEAVENMLKDKNAPAVTVRGVPSDTADIHNNWFFNPKEPRDQPVDRWTDEAIVQMHVTEWSNVAFWDNHYGDTDPDDCNVGAPRDGCPAP
ncbi:MAG: sugar-binding protein [Persicimonas sp.]